MADQVEIQIPLTSVNERTQLIGTAYFRTRSTGAASTPTTVHYKVSNVSNDTVVKDWTTISAAANVTLTITADLNKILSNHHRVERMEVLVAADKGLSTEAIGRAGYLVKNVYGREN